MVFQSSVPLDRTGRTLTKLALAQRLESLSATNDIFIKKKNCPLAHSSLLNCCRVETLERTDMRERERERGTFTRSFTSLWAEFRAAIRSMKSFGGGWWRRKRVRYNSSSREEPQKAPSRIHYDNLVADVDGRRVKSRAHHANALTFEEPWRAAKAEWKI